MIKYEKFSKFPKYDLKIYMSAREAPWLKGVARGD